MLNSLYYYELSIVLTKSAGSRDAYSSKYELIHIGGVNSAFEILSFDINNNDKLKWLKIDNNLNKYILMQSAAMINDRWLINFLLWV